MPLAACQCIDVCIETLVVGRVCSIAWLEGTSTNSPDENHPSYRSDSGHGRALQPVLLSLPIGVNAAVAPITRYGAALHVLFGLA